MAFYSAFGLCIHSELAIPEFAVAQGVESDVVIRFGKIAHVLIDSNDAMRFCVVSDGEVLCYWKDYGAFLVKKGQEIVIEPSPRVDENIIRLLLVGPVIAVLLHQRKLLVLHASAVAIDGHAVVFMGAKGQGKSTMAASLYGQGHLLISDDVVAVRGTDAPKDALTIIPGFPQLKLWPDAAASALGDDPQKLPLLASGYDKRARRIPDRFAGDSLPIRKIYVLGHGPILQVKQLSARDALIQVMTHSYIARYGRAFLQGSESVRHLVQCTNLVECVPVYSLERPFSISSASESARFVERHLME